MKTLRLRIITPSKVLFEGDVEMVKMRAFEGDMAVLPGHGLLMTTLAYGVLKAVSGEKEEFFSVLGGYAEILPDQVTILSDAAERPDEIDRERAEAAKERARRILENARGASNERFAELAFRRALVRLEVSSYPLVSNRGD